MLGGCGWRGLGCVGWLRWVGCEWCRLGWVGWWWWLVVIDSIVMVPVFFTFIFIFFYINLMLFFVFVGWVAMVLTSSSCNLGIDNFDSRQVPNILEFYLLAKEFSYFILFIYLICNFKNHGLASFKSKV